MFDWRDYLTLAEELSKRPGDECALRTSISRAYYAAYNEAQQYCAKNNIKITSIDGQSYNELWHTLKNRAGHTSKAIGVNGLRLKTSRVAADYRPQIPNLAAATTDALILTEKILYYMGRSRT